MQCQYLRRRLPGIGRSSALLAPDGHVVSTFSMEYGNEQCEVGHSRTPTSRALVHSLVYNRQAVVAKLWCPSRYATSG